MITVFTPTYNRANTLEKLYQSLLSQTYKNYEWVIVDDGSSDNTEAIVNSWVKENLILINYYKQINGGKHRAINKGLDLAKGELFFIVDSDDYLPKDSLATISEYHLNNINKELAGYAFRRKYQDDLIIGKEFPQKEFISNHVEKTYILKLKGDLAEVIKTDVLRKFKFPNFENEKFCAEGLLWNRLAKNNYKILFINEPIYIGQYLEGGLTDNSLKNRRKSPSYATLIYKELAEYKKLPIKQKLRAYINYWRFASFTNKTFMEQLKFINYNFIAILAYPLGKLAQFLDSKKLMK